MIEEPPSLTIRKGWTRPTRPQIAAFEGVLTGNIIDCLDGSGALDHRVKPLPGLPDRFVGTAVTCACGPADNLGVFGTLPVLQPGDVVVAATGAYERTALVGDLLVGMLRNGGAVAVVTDGMARDLPGIQGMGIPVFCAGITPNSPVRNGPAVVGEPIVLCDVRVASGDVVIGDQDGVVIVPYARIDGVIARLAQVRTLEVALEVQVKGGLVIPEYLKEVLDRRTRWV